MYYQKFFSGNCASQYGNSYNINKDRTKSTYALQSSYYSVTRSRVLCDAVVEVLKECGLDAKSGFDLGFNDVPYIFLDYEHSNVGFYLYYGATSSTASTNGLKCKIGYRNKGDSSVYIVPGSSASYTNVDISYSYSPFNPNTYQYSVATDYQFAVTVKGETKSAFNIYIGAYNKPYAEAYGKCSYTGHLVITVRRIKNLKTDSPVWSINCSSVVNAGDQAAVPAATTEWRNYFQLINGDMDMVPALASVNSYNSTAGITLLASSPSTILMQDNFVNLVPAYLSYPQFVVEDAYVFGGLPTNDEFYEVDGDIYYRLGTLLVKCTTVPQAS